MNAALTTLRTRLIDAVKSGGDTGHLREKIRQLESEIDPARVASEPNRDTAGQKAAEISEINARTAELVDATYTAASTAVQPIESTMITAISPRLKALVEDAARRAVTGEINQAEAIANEVAQRDVVQQLKSRSTANILAIEELRALSKMRPLNESERATLNLAMLDKDDLAIISADAAREVSAAIDLGNAARAKLGDAQATLAALTAQAEFEFRLSQARDLESALVTCLDKVWSAAKTIQPQARWVAVWQPGSQLKRATTLGQPPLGGIA